MEEKSKGFSLRQKKSSRRPPISAPKQITSAATSKQLALQGRTNGGSEASAGNFAPGNPQKGARERPRLGGGTSDLVKRRYSTRFTNPPDFSAAQSAPPIPTVPSQHALQVASTHKINIDLDALKEDGLDVEKCMC